jgi:hypothetical protein
MKYYLLTAGLLLATAVEPVSIDKKLNNSHNSKTHETKAYKLTIDRILLLNKAATHMDYQALESCIQFLKSRLEIVEKCDFSYDCLDYIKESIPKNILTCLRSINPTQIQLAIDLLEVIRLQSEKNIIDIGSSSGSIQMESSLYNRRLSNSSTGTQYTVNLLEVDDRQSEISTVTDKTPNDFIHDESSLPKKRLSNSLADIEMYIDSLEVDKFQTKNAPVTEEALNNTIHDESSLSKKRLSNSLDDIEMYIGSLEADKLQTESIPVTKDALNNSMHNESSLPKKRLSNSLADIEMYIDSLEIDELQSESDLVTDKSSISNERLRKSLTNIQSDNFAKTACKLIPVDNDISEALLVC